MTDGAQTPPGNPFIPANKLKAREFEIYAVGAGSAQQRQLELLQNRGLYFVQSIYDIPKLAFQVAQKICPSKYSE